MDSGIAICNGKQALVAVLSKGEELLRNDRPHT